MTSPDITVLHSQRSVTMPNPGVWSVKNIGPEDLIVAYRSMMATIKAGESVVCRPVMFASKRMARLISWHIQGSRHKKGHKKGRTKIRKVNRA